MKNIILKQREERNELLARNYIVRQTKYGKEDLLGVNLIKLITGPRRVGKSVFALQLLNGQNFAYLNFDDKLLLDNWNEDLVMEMLSSVYGDYRFLLLDEVQNLGGWDLWVAKLYRRGVNMIITGSNAKMLSSEMATVLTGRYIQIEMLPFSLQDTMLWNGIYLHDVKEEQLAQCEALTEEYLHNGGFPETLPARLMARNYLGTLFDSILLKDIAQRHNVRKTTDLYNLASYLLSNFCNQFSYRDLTAELNLTSITTTKKFCNYLHEPYLFFYLSRYDNKLKLMKKAPQKVYVVDNGFVCSSGFNVGENLGRLLENQVFVELMRRGYSPEKTMFYYRSRNNREVDFVLRDGVRIKQLIQVCYDMTSAKTRKREQDAIVECAKELGCDDLLIITRNEEGVVEHKGLQVKITNITSF